MPLHCEYKIIGIYIIYIIKRAQSGYNDSVYNYYYRGVKFSLKCFAQFAFNVLKFVWNQ